MLRPCPLSVLLLPQFVYLRLYLYLYFPRCMSVFTYVSLGVQVLMPRPLSDVPTARLPPQPVAKNTLPATCTYSNLPPPRELFTFSGSFKTGSILPDLWGCQPLPHHLGLQVSVVEQLDRHWLLSRFKGTQLSGCQV